MFRFRTTSPSIDAAVFERSRFLLESRTVTGANRRGGLEKIGWSSMNPSFQTAGLPPIVHRDQEYLQYIFKEMIIDSVLCGLDRSYRKLHLYRLKISRNPIVHPCIYPSAEFSLGPSRSRSLPEMRLFSSNEWDLFELLQNGVDSRGVNSG